MKKHLQRLAFPMILLTAACSQKPAEETAPSSSTPAQAAAPTPAPAAPVVDRGNVDFLEAPLDGSSNESHGLEAGQAAVAEFASLRAGNVVGVEVQVGNYGNSSTGEIEVKVCQGANCSEGRADLGSSQDNEYFHVPLSAPLAVTADQPLQVTFTRVSGENRMALWSYPASAASSKLTLPGGSPVPRSLKIGLRYSR